MNAVGIVAEYDPFHSGHARHISLTRQRIGSDCPVVAVMSGNWTQRGECALADKWLRGELAVLGGRTWWWSCPHSGPPPPPSALPGEPWRFYGQPV